MTAFFTRCFASALEASAAFLRYILLIVGISLSLLVQADSGVRSAEVSRTDDGAYVVNADFDLELSPRLADAISRGVSLYFAVEFEIERSRWWWFDKTVIERKLNYRLSYNAITRNYRLSVGSLHRSYDSIEAALNTMRRVRNWHIADEGLLDPGRSYNARIRLLHDKSMLPRPFQVTVFGGREWTAGTDWHAWQFEAGGGK